MIVAGLNANGFNRDEWIAGGKQEFFEEGNFTPSGYVGSYHESRIMNQYLFVNYVCKFPKGLNRSQLSMCHSRSSTIHPCTLLHNYRN